MIAIGIEKPDPTIQLSPSVSLMSAFGSVTNIIFAYAGHVAFFSFISELKKPEEYYKALFVLQGADVTLYVIAAVVIYRYGGPEVASPALGSTARIVQKVAYGIALPTVRWQPLEYPLKSFTNFHRTDCHCRHYQRPRRG